MAHHDNIGDTEIREPRARDLAALPPLFETVGFGAAPDEIARRLQGLNSAEHVVRVATRSGRPVGIVTMHVYPVLHRAHPVGRITLLVVSEDARRQGIGRALVERVEGEASARGCEVIEVISNHRYADAYGFYERLGYELSSVKFKRTLRSADEP